jgi:1,2-phenylacetyl-CoA epoxidase PaaB subunit
MSRSERLIDLLKLREAMRARRQARAVGELSSEIDRSKTIQEKLLGLIKANTPLDEPMTSFELRSRAWYGRQMQEQHSLLENRGSFLEMEIMQARKVLMRHKNRESIIEERRIAVKQAEAEDREALAERQMPPSGTRHQR